MYAQYLQRLFGISIRNWIANSLSVGGRGHLDSLQKLDELALVGLNEIPDTLIQLQVVVCECLESIEEIIFNFFGIQLICFF